MSRRLTKNFAMAGRKKNKSNKIKIPAKKNLKDFIKTEMAKKKLTVYRIQTGKIIQQVAVLGHVFNNDAGASRDACERVFN